MFRTRFVLAVLAMPLVSCVATFEPGDVEPTPQRPRISKNTRTTANDTIEMEAGVHWDPQDFVDTPITVKYGASDSLEYFFEVAPIRVFDYPGDNESGIGDVAFGVRHRFQDETESQPALAFEFVGKMPTDDRGDEARNTGLGTGGRDPRIGLFTTGGTDFRIAGMGEREFGPINAAAYVALNALGSPAGGTIYELLVATHATYDVTESDQIFVELVGTMTESAPDKALLQGGFARRVAANMTMDTAVGMGLNGDSPAFYVMLGLTTNFGFLR